MIRPEHIRTTINLHLNIFDTRKEFLQAVKPHLTTIELYDADLVEGFARWSPSTTYCEIYLTKAKYEGDFKNWGHELAHCVYGRWHR